MPNYSPQYFLGYKLRPACNTCAMKVHMVDQEPLPFSAFPAGELPPSLVAHWIPPHRPSASPSISSCVSFRTHCVKWPSPGQILYTADEILQELKELMKKSNWWT